MCTSIYTCFGNGSNTDKLNGTVSNHSVIIPFVIHATTCDESYFPGNTLNVANVRLNPRHPYRRRRREGEKKKKKKKREAEQEYEEEKKGRRWI